MPNRNVKPTGGYISRRTGPAHRRSIFLLWRRLPPTWRLIVMLVVTLRVALGLIGAFAIRLDPPQPPQIPRINLMLTGNDFWSQSLSAWQRWNALGFQQIAAHGYHAGDGTASFSPLYPLLSRLVSLVAGGRIVAAELLVSTAALSVGLWLFYRLARAEIGAGPAYLAVALLALFPTSFFLLAPFAEGLFLVWSLATFYFARRRDLWRAGWCGLAATLTQAQGVLLAVPLAFEYARRSEERDSWSSLKALAVALPPAGFAGLRLYLRLVVGDHGTGPAIAEEQGARIVAPWQALWTSWTHIVQTGDAIEMMNLGCLLGFAALTLWGARRVEASYSLSIAPQMVLLLCRQMPSSPLMSVSRYALVLFPCFIVLASWLARRPWLAAAWLAVGAMLQVVLFQYQAQWGFVG